MESINFLGYPSDIINDPSCVTPNVKFVPRFTPPEPGNPYYNRYTEGGYSGAIYGKPKNPNCTILANCAGYSQARLCEASNRNACDLLEPSNPVDMDKYLYGKCTVGQVPKLGAIMIWVKDDNPRQGHCANVEAIMNDTMVVTSESHYGGVDIDWQIHYTQNGKRFYKPGYTFKEFIYSPYIEA